MGEMTDKLKGAANSLTGKAKQAAGERRGDPDLAAEGQMQDAKGGLQNLKGKVKGALGDKI